MANPEKPDEVNSLAGRLSALDPASASSNKAEIGKMGLDGYAQEPSGAATPAGGEEANGKSAVRASNLLDNLEHEVEVKLADQQADPNSPLYSAKTFEELNLDPRLLKNLYKMGFSRPSKIQERALPMLLQQPPTNFIGQSQSGTGKTAAFVLTMLSAVDPSLQAPQCICVAPSRELARQIFEVTNQMSLDMPITKALAAPGTLERGAKITAQVVVGTPGTMKDCTSSHKIAGTMDPVLGAKDLKVFVIDEADMMLETGSLSDQCVGVKNNIRKIRGRGGTMPQIVLFSATFADHVRDFASKFAPGANEIQLKKEELTLEGIKQFFLDCDGEQAKYNVLVELYNILTIGQSIIFAQRRSSADEIARRMNAEGHKVAVLHGAQEGEGRDETIDAFRDGKVKVLLTTNVIARGIDISQVNLVINYDLPRSPKGPDAETYLHRIGRTGRFGKKGISINFVATPAEWRDMMTIKNTLGMSDDMLIRVETTDYDRMEEVLKKALKS